MSSSRHHNAAQVVLGIVACTTFLLCAAPLGNTQPNAATSPRTSQMQAERQRAWDVIARVTQASDGTTPAFASWRHAEAVLGSKTHAKSGTPAASMGQSAEPEIIIYTFYNETADRHIRDHRLHVREQLDRLLSDGAPAPELTHNRTIAPLPDSSIVLLTAWWPVAREGSTPLPVWDPENNPPRRHGNSYITWPRVVAIDRHVDGPAAPISFVGRSFDHAPRVALDRFHHFPVDRHMADRLMQDSRTRKAAVIALGRGIEAGDSLALVAMHVATKQSGLWHWATLWWHDQADRGPFAGDRPRLASPWNNYLMDAALATGAPDDPDICFNPWLEARFPDQGAGGGTVSNCVACHQRASYPPVNFLPIRRGAPDFSGDPAYAPGRLRTDSLWSIARQFR